MAKTKKKPAKKPAKKSAAKKPAPMAPRRADYGAPIDAWFTKQPQPQRAIAEALRALIEEAAPEATAALKWGMPFFTLNGTMMCAVAGFKSHVNLILSKPPGGFDDPKGLLEGDAKTGRHLKLRSLAEIPRDDIRRWLRAAVSAARAARA